MAKYKQRCEGCGRGTDNISGECDWCVEREREYIEGDGYGDDDVSAAERSYEKYIGRT